MSIRPVKAMPISYVRSHTKEVLNLVNSERHVLLTKHGKPAACIIPYHDARVLWQLQTRPVEEMDERLKAAYARWLRAKSLDEKWEGIELDDKKWVSWWGLEKM